MFLSSRRVATVVLSALLAACHQGPAPPAPGQRVDVPHARSDQIVEKVGNYHTELTATLEEVADAVPEVYQQLGLPVTPSQHTEVPTWATPNMRITGRLYEGELNSEYVDCGRGPRGPIADIYEIDFQVVTELRPAPGGGTQVDTRVEGSARDRTISGNRVPCSGTGKLEREIAAMLKRTTG
jgi:hypothetical protein